MEQNLAAHSALPALLGGFRHTGQTDDKQNARLSQEHEALKDNTWLLIALHLVVFIVSNQEHDEGEEDADSRQDLAELTGVVHPLKHVDFPVNLSTILRVDNRHLAVRIVWVV